MQIRPGHSKAKFVDRCAEINACICEALGDYDAQINGERVCVVVDGDAFKDESFDVAFNTSIVEICWLVRDMNTARCGDEVILCNQQFKIKEGPINRLDGWFRAELDHICELC